MGKVTIRRNFGSGAALSAYALRRAQASAAVPGKSAPAVEDRKTVNTPGSDRVWMEHCELLSYLHYVLRTFPRMEEQVTDWEDEFLVNVAGLVRERRLSDGQVRVLREIISKVTSGSTYWESFITARRQRLYTYSWIGPARLEQMSIRDETALE